jgi:ABC-type sugar transport system ATPase subunit
MAPILRLSRITKRFPGVTALDGVDFELAPGEIHALMGENGAGKSTLVNVISGLIRPTSGMIFLDEKEVRFDSSLDSQRAGISTITQEFNLIPKLTVAENIFLGREPVTRAGTLNWTEIRHRAESILSELGLNVPLNQRVEYLSVGDRQLVEVAKALSLDFRVITMDEPTAALNASEVSRLFQIIRTLKARGTAVLYVSHRLNEVFRIADRVTVIRDGKRVGTRPMAELDEKSIVGMMLGRELDLRQILEERRTAGNADVALLSVKELTIPGAVKSLSFDLQRDEILGCAGLIGSGRDELTKALFGLAPYSSGSISLEGRPLVLRDPFDAMREGIYMLPEDRKTEGVFPDLTVLENLLINAPPSNLQRSRSRGFIDQRLEHRTYDSIRSTLNIRAQSPEQLIVKLSGGNQQKVLIGRALVSRSRILLLNEPTRGVDVGTKLEIHSLIRKLAKEGISIIVSSSDVPELVSVSDRCLVLSAGKAAGMLGKEEITEENITTLAIGQKALPEVS